MKQIKSISISNSPFFEDLKISFSAQLNCIMGGRGTGKTTILYFLKSCLNERAEDDDRIKSILRTNLGNGEINVLVEGENGKDYQITKTYNDLPQPHELPNSEFIDASLISDLVECDFYEAGNIEMIGRSRFDRLLLLDKRIKPQIKPLKNEVDEIQIDLKNNAQDIRSFDQRIYKLKNTLSQYEGIDEEFENHKLEQPKGINESEKEEFEIADVKEKKRENEKRFFSKLLGFYNDMEVDINYKINELDDRVRSIKQGEKAYVNGKEMSLAENRFQENIDAFKVNFDKLLERIKSSTAEAKSQYDQLMISHTSQQAAFVKLKQKFQINREYINRYNRLSKQQNDRNNLLKDLEELENKKVKFTEIRKSLIEKLNSIKQDIFEKRLMNVNELNEQFEGDIVINLFFGGITDEYEEKLRNVLRGSGMRYNELIPRIVSNFTPDEFAEVIQNEKLSELSTVSGIDEVRSNSLINALKNTDAIFEIEALYCDDLPEFKLRVHGNTGVEENYRKSDELSMGQRCTTVLPIIFAVSENPLIIDQPEDNLDNKYIAGNIHKIIKKQKATRQLIFITHNPNIPVLSDSENNIFLTYDKKSNIDSTGTVEEVREDIVNLLEGGREAFDFRRVKYGY